MRLDNPARHFDPALAPRGARMHDGGWKPPRASKLAHYETQNYAAYYQKDWLRLLRVSVGMVRQSFGLSWLQAVYAAYLVARGEMAFAPFPDNDVPAAEAWVRRFYQFIKGIHHEDFDVARAAHLEVNWWIVHRKLFANAENRELAHAVRDLYAEAYGIEPAKLEQAAALRVQGMLYSDLWVNAGKPAGSPLLAQEEEALYQGYAALKQVINQ